jgi:hypothetical protein
VVAWLVVVGADVVVVGACEVVVVVVGAWVVVDDDDGVPVSELVEDGALVADV